MIGLLRIALIMLIIFLIQRAFSGTSASEEGTDKSVKINRPPDGRKAKVSKEIGEYVEYEDIDKKN
jgi:hypothetical protein